MAQFRKALPQLGGDFFLTDGGIETTLIFLEGQELPDFAAFHLLKTEGGEAALRKYFRTYSGLAEQFGTGLILESATWRASSDWGSKLGYSAKEMADANRRAISLLEEIRREFKGNPETIFAYSGKYMIEGERFVTDVDVASLVEWTGAQQVRTCRFVGSRLQFISNWAPSPFDPSRTTRGIIEFEREA